MMINATRSPALDSLNVAATYLSAVLTGPFATAVAIVCVAGIGFAALGGRLPVRRATTVIFGCFMIFNAAYIASGLMRAVAPNLAQSTIYNSAETVYVPPPAPFSTSSYDPYAGAAVQTP